MLNRKTWWALLMLSAVTGLGCTVPTGSGQSPNATTSALDRAEVMIGTAYETVLQAERAGANVSGLLTQLNIAGAYLTDAHIQWTIEAYEAAILLANQSYDVGMNVENEALAKEKEALSNQFTAITVNILGSIIAVVVIGFTSAFGWGAFKRRYTRTQNRLASGADEHDGGQGT